MTPKEIDAMNKKIMNPETTSIWGFDDISQEDFELLSDEAQTKLEKLAQK